MAVNNGIEYLEVSVFCALTGLPVTSVFFALWRKSRNLEIEFYKDVATFVKMYRRISIKEVASNLNLSEKDAERAVLKAVEMGYLKAYIDRKTNEIVTPEGIKLSKEITVHCPNCGAQISGVYLTGEIVECPYCGTKFKIVK